MQAVFAPMEGITGYLYRSAHRRWFGGVERYFMPFLSPTQNHVFTRRELQELLPEHNQGLEAVPQLLTRRAEDFLWAAGELARMGYREVNLNLGCPSGTVVAKGKGSGLLADPQVLDRFLEEIFSHVEVAVSVKTRLGLDQIEEFPPLLEVFNRYPIARLTIHPRVQRDFYRRPVRLEAFSAALPLCRAPVCYNGDLASVGQVQSFAGRFPQVDQVMIGRGLVANPALARQIQGGKGPDREALAGFHDDLFQSYASVFGSAHSAMMRMKEVWCYLIQRYEGADRPLKELRKAKDPMEYQRLAHRILHTFPLSPAD